MRNEIMVIVRSGWVWLGWVGFNNMRDNTEIDDWILWRVPGACDRTKVGPDNK